MLLRVSKFLETHINLFPPDSIGGQAYATIVAAIATLSSQAMSKMSNRNDGIVEPTVLARKALRRQVHAITRSAREIARTKPGFDTPFRAPDTFTDQALLTAGRLFVQEAEKQKALFFAYHLQPDFITTLQAAVDQFETLLSSRETGLDHHTQAKVGIDATLAAAMDAVRTLDVMVTNQFAGDAATLAVWERDRKVDYKRRVRRPTIGTEPQAGAQTAPVLRLTGSDGASS
jgi:hypothetical protein